jgi:hypothetical protein
MSLPVKINYFGGPLRETLTRVRPTVSPAQSGVRG